MLLAIRHMWSSIKNIAPKILEQKGLRQKVQTSLVIKEANQLLAEMLGDQTQDKIRIIFYKDKTLTLAVLVDELMQALTEHQADFISELNKRLKEKAVDKLKFLY